MSRFTVLLALAVLLGALLPTAQAEYVTSGLAAYYDARDMSINGIGRGSGTTWNDRSGSGNHATLTSSSFAAEVASTGSNIHSEGGESIAIAPGTQDVLGGSGLEAIGSNGINTVTGLTGATVEVFFRLPRKGDGQSILSATGVKSSTPTFPGPRMWAVDEDFDDSGRIETQFLIDPEGIGSTTWYGLQVGSLMPNNDWLHLISKWDTNQDSGQVRTWINGVEVAHTSLNGGGTTGTLNPNALGIPRLGVLFDAGGAFGFTRFYTRGLSDGEVAQNYADAATYFIPEPGTLLLLASGLAGLLLFRRRR